MRLFDFGRDNLIVIWTIFKILVFQDENVKTSTHPIFQRYPDVRDETQKWLREQKEQSVLMHGPYQLTGIRVKVYRLGSTTQWFTAVITWHDLLSRVRRSLILIIILLMVVLLLLSSSSSSSSSSSLLYFIGLYIHEQNSNSNSNLYLIPKRKLGLGFTGSFKTSKKLLQTINHIYTDI